MTNQCLLVLATLFVACAAFDTKCSDHNEHCEYWSDAGECDKNAVYMLKVCASACGACTSSDKIDESQPVKRSYMLTPSGGHGSTAHCDRQVGDTEDGCFQQIADADWQCVNMFALGDTADETACRQSCIANSRCRSVIYGNGECRLYAVAGIAQHTRGKRQNGVPTLGSYGPRCAPSLYPRTGFVYSESVGGCTVEPVTTTTTTAATTTEATTIATTTEDPGCQNYYVIEGQVLFGFANDVTTASSLDDCLQICIDQGDDCVSGLYVAAEPEDNCILNFETEETQPEQIESDPGFDYFEPRCIDDL